MCAEGCEIGYLIISPIGTTHGFSTWLEFDCIINQVEYEELVVGLQHLVDMKVRDIESIGDSNLVVQ
jgi:ribonuclease HI